jgi:hypothetical protein
MQNAPLNLVMSVRPHVATCATPTRQISVEFDIGDFYNRNVKEIKILFKSGKNTGHFTSRSVRFTVAKRHYTAIHALSAVKVSDY